MLPGDSLYPPMHHNQHHNQHHTLAALALGVLVALGACRHAGSPAQTTEQTAQMVPTDPWADPPDDVLHQQIADARQRAQASGRKVLLEFIAPWCPDCRAMTDLEAQRPASDVLAERYERVRVNVGPAFDHHTDLLHAYGVLRIANYVVLDATTGQRVAQTTVEPVTGHVPMTSARWAAWLRDPR